VNWDRVWSHNFHTTGLRVRGDIKDALGASIRVTSVLVSLWWRPEPVPDGPPGQTNSLLHGHVEFLKFADPRRPIFLRSLPAILAAEVFGMKSNSDWQNRLGTIRVAALGVMVVAIGVIWYIRH
jgi:hypothetical protein